jgi:tetratricopeptide (TPR) repeat protein
MSAVSTDIDVILKEAVGTLSSEDAASASALLSAAEKSPDSAKADYYRQLSGLWYDFKRPAVAGYYAEQVALLSGGEEAWSIAGTTYSICVQQEKNEKIKAFCTQKAIETLEKAVSVNPGELRHKVNLSLVYAENPPKDNPMKGVLMLVDLNKKNPGQPMVLAQLGRLAIKTGQFEKAVERLEQAVRAEPGHVLANCLLAQAYEGTGMQDQAAAFQQKCNELSGRTVE